MLKTLLRDSSLTTSEHISHIRSLRNTQKKLNKLRTKFFNYKDLQK